MNNSVIRVDEFGRTSIPNVYAGGDGTSVNRSVGAAIAAGKRAAIGIDLFLRKVDEKVADSLKKNKSGVVSMSHYLAGEVTISSNGVVSFEKLNTCYFTPAARLKAAELPIKTRLLGFDETNLGLSRVEAIAEAERCFRCGCCDLCENCYIFCPDVAISFDAETQAFTIDRNKCKVCGICINECPRKALDWEGGS